MNTKILAIGLGVAGLLLNGCALSQPKPVVKHKAVAAPICSKLQRPQFLSFKQVAFAVSKKENLDIGKIVDFYFFDDKFKASNYTSLPQLKIDLEKRHNVNVKVENYALTTKPVNIMSYDLQFVNWFKMAKESNVAVKKGSYKVGELDKYINKFVHFRMDDSFKNFNVVFEKDAIISIFDLVNKITKTIARRHNYDYNFNTDVLSIVNIQRNLVVKKEYLEPFVAMLKRENIYYIKNSNSFVVRDSFYKLWYATLYLKSLNLSEDRFTYCVHTDGKDYYGNFTGNDNVVIGGFGKIRVVDYGSVYNGKLKYKLVIRHENTGAKEEYVIYNSKHDFDVNLDKNTEVKVRLY